MRSVKKKSLKTSLESMTFTCNSLIKLTTEQSQKASGSELATFKNLGFDATRLILLFKNFTRLDD